jgi:hypothetical protein
VKHAGSDALDRLEPLLEELRSLEDLTERKRGIFYQSGQAFLHFHEDPTGLHADVRLADDFDRRRVETRAEQRSLLSEIKRAAKKPVR